jgi:uncharacterized protein YkwD
MKSKVNFVLGFLIGAVIFSGATAFAAGIAAKPTTSKVFVNGAEIQADAYNINGSNYFKLRDIGKAVGFSVAWDGAGDRILIDTMKPYETGESARPSEVTATPIAAAAADPATSPVQTATSMMTIDEMKSEVVRLTNEARAKAGLPALKPLPELMECTQAKAQDLLDNMYYGHESPTYGKPLAMVKSFGIPASGCSENIAPGRNTPQEVVDGWMGSEGHRANILNAKRTHIGVGIIPTTDGKSYMWVEQMITLK